MGTGFQAILICGTSLFLSAFCLCKTSWWAAWSLWAELIPMPISIIKGTLQIICYCKTPTLRMKHFSAKKPQAAMLDHTVGSKHSFTMSIQVPTCTPASPHQECSHWTFKNPYRKLVKDKLVCSPLNLPLSTHMQSDSSFLQFWCKVLVHVQHPSQRTILVSIQRWFAYHNHYFGSHGWWLCFWIWSRDSGSVPILEQFRQAVCPWARKKSSQWGRNPMDTTHGTGPLNLFCIWL